MARIAPTLAAAAVALATAGSLAAPAQAHDGGPGGAEFGVTVAPGAASALTGNGVTIKALGKADESVVQSRTVLSFPVLGSSGRAGHHGRRAVTSLAGGVAFVGPTTARWTHLRVNESTNRVTAIVGGDRRAVLAFRGSCSVPGGRTTERHGGDQGGHGDHGTELRLTRSGARSIDRAAGHDTLGAGDAFAFSER